MTRYPYLVGKKAAQIMRLLVLQGYSKLKALFKGCLSRSEIVATFLAVLDLVRSNCVSLQEEQKDTLVQFEKLPDAQVTTEFD